MVVHRALGHVVLSQNYLPRVIPTKTFYLFLSDIYSDILSGILPGIYSLAYILTFFVAKLSGREEEERTTLMKSETFAL